MKKKVAVVLLAVVVASLAIYGTYALLTAQYSSHTEITAGNVAIELLNISQSDGFTTKSVDTGASSGQHVSNLKGVVFAPGGSAEKKVAVKKLTGSADCWIRVRFEQTVLLKGETEPRSVDEAVISLEFDDTGWLSGTDEHGQPDGWYYHLAPLTGDAPLSDLLTAFVTFMPAMGNEYQGAEYAINVVAEAVQNANNPVPAGGNVADVIGWSD